jgi:hypothetical protein
VRAWGLVHFLDIGKMNRAIFVDNSTFGVFLGAADGLLHDADTFDSDLLLANIDGNNLAGLAAMVTSDDFDFITWLDVCFDTGHLVIQG